MLDRRSALALMVVLALGGCAAKAPPPEKAKIAAETKQLVTQFAEKAKSAQPKVAAADLAVLLETLEAREKSFGGHAAVLTAAKDLQAAYQSSAPPAKVKEQLEKFKQAAAAL